MNLLKQNHGLWRPADLFRVAVWLLAAILFLGSVRSAQSQGVVEATVDRNRVTTDDRILLTVQVNAQPDSQPTLPPMDDFRVVGSSSASQISIVNGVTTASFAYRYQLQPVEAGSFRIDPINVVIDGVSYQTNAITVEVEQGTNPSPDDIVDEIIPPGDLAGQDFYVEAEIDNAAPVVGQQVLYIFRFYQAVELLGRPSYTPPDFVGFWNQQESQQTQTLSNVEDRTYRITSLVSPLFPTIGGERTIEPAKFNLPDRRVLLTEPVEINVQPLPEPAPDDFTGAVGQYEISAEIDTANVAVNDAITWRVRVAGIGNIDTLPEPNWPEMDGWRIFDDKSVVNTEFANGIIGGNRIYERILIPGEAGEFILPALTYTFYDPNVGEYRTAVTQEFPIIVRDGGDSAEIEEANEVAALVEIAPLRETPGSLRKPSSLLSSPLFWGLWFVPLLVLGGDKLLRVRAARGEEAQVEKQKRNALRNAQQAIKEVRADKSKSPDQEAERILTNYLGEKFNEPFVGLSQTNRADQLRNHGVRESLIRWTNKIYDRAEGVRYGYKGAEVGKLLDETEQLISRFERIEGVS